MKAAEKDKKGTTDKGRGLSAFGFVRTTTPPVGTDSETTPASEKAYSTLPSPETGLIHDNPLPHTETDIDDEKCSFSPITKEYSCLQSASLQTPSKVEQASKFLSMFDGYKKKIAADGLASHETTPVETLKLKKRKRSTLPPSDGKSEELPASQFHCTAVLECALEADSQPADHSHVEDILPRRIGIAEDDNFDDIPESHETMAQTHIEVNQPLIDVEPSGTESIDTPIQDIRADDSAQDLESATPLVPAGRRSSRIQALQAQRELIHDTSCDLMEDSDEDRRRSRRSRNPRNQTRSSPNPVDDCVIIDSPATNKKNEKSSNPFFLSKHQRAELRLKEEEQERLTLQAEREARVRALMNSERRETDKIISTTHTQRTSQIATMFTRTISVGKEKEKDRDMSKFIGVDDRDLVEAPFPEESNIGYARDLYAQLSGTSVHPACGLIVKNRVSSAVLPVAQSISSISRAVDLCEDIPELESSSVTDVASDLTALSLKSNWVNCRLQSRKSVASQGEAAALKVDIGLLLNPTLAYLPVCSDILECKAHLRRWLQEWTRPSRKANSRTLSRRCELDDDEVAAFDDSDGESYGNNSDCDVERIFMVMGSDGAGKTSAVREVAQELNMGVLEINAGTERSASHLRKLIAEASQTRRVNIGQEKDRRSAVVEIDCEDIPISREDSAGSVNLSLILIDEADLVLSKSEESGFHSTLMSLARYSKVPLVLTMRREPCAFYSFPARRVFLARPALVGFVVALKGYIRSNRLFPHVNFCLESSLVKLGMATRCDVRSGQRLLDLIGYQPMRGNLFNDSDWLLSKNADFSIFDRILEERGASHETNNEPTPEVLHAPVVFDIAPRFLWLNGQDEGDFISDSTIGEPLIGFTVRGRNFLQRGFHSLDGDVGFCRVSVMIAGHPVDRVNVCGDDELVVSVRLSLLNQLGRGAFAVTVLVNRSHSQQREHHVFRMNSSECGLGSSWVYVAKGDQAAREHPDPLKLLMLGHGKSYASIQKKRLKQLHHRQLSAVVHPVPASVPEPNAAKKRTQHKLLLMRKKCKREDAVEDVPPSEDQDSGVPAESEVCTTKLSESVDCSKDCGADSEEFLESDSDEKLPTSLTNVSRSDATALLSSDSEEAETDNAGNEEKGAECDTCDDKDAKADEQEQCEGLEVKQSGCDVKGLDSVCECKPEVIIDASEGIGVPSAWEDSTVIASPDSDREDSTGDTAANAEDRLQSIRLQLNVIEQVRDRNKGQSRAPPGWEFADDDPSVALVSRPYSVPAGAAESVGVLQEMCMAFDVLCDVDSLRHRSSQTNNQLQYERCDIVRGALCSALTFRSGLRTAGAAIPALLGSRDRVIDLTDMSDEISASPDSEERIISDPVDVIEGNDASSNNDSVPDIGKLRHRIDCWANEQKLLAVAEPSAFLRFIYKRSQCMLQLSLFAQRYLYCQDNFHAAAVLRKLSVVCDTLPYITKLAQAHYSVGEKIFELSMNDFLRSQANKRRTSKNSSQEPTRPVPCDMLCQGLQCLPEDLNDLTLAMYALSVRNNVLIENNSKGR